MNKNELINSLSEETTFSKKDVSRVLDSLTRIIERTLKKGEKVSITGFGGFWISHGVLVWKRLCIYWKNWVIPRKD